MDIDVPDVAKLVSRVDGQSVPRGPSAPMSGEGFHRNEKRPDSQPWLSLVAHSAHWYFGAACNPYAPFPTRADTIATSRTCGGTSCRSPWERLPAAVGPHLSRLTFPR